MTEKLLGGHEYLHVDDEGMGYGTEYGLLTVDVLNLSQPNHLGDCHDLQSKVLSCGDVPSQHHSPKRPSP